MNTELITMLSKKPTIINIFSGSSLSRREEIGAIIKNHKNALRVIRAGLRLAVLICFFL